MKHREYKYTICYEHIKKLIEDEVLKPGDKLPSLLSCAKELSISKTTVETAYFQLEADGYVISREKSGHYVSSRKIDSSKEEVTRKEAVPKAEDVSFDLSCLGDDPTSFRFDLWQRYLKSAVRRTERMATFGEPQGEEDLREAICDYVRKQRNIYCSPENIIIGGSTQNLLMILLSILKEVGFRTASVPARGFEKYAKIFDLQGLKVDIRRKEADIIYVTPSLMTLWGDVMPVRRRYEILEHSKNGHLIIEDDYQNEFVYSKQIKPSIYGLSGGENVVYIGSFSKVLMPSIRISFMILPKKIISEYKDVLALYDQTASKAEQMALCSFLRDNHIYRQIKKLRKLYSSKRSLLKEILSKLINGIDGLNVLTGESGTEMAITGDSDSICHLKARLKEYGIRAIESDAMDMLLFSCGVISTADLIKLRDSL